MPSASCSAPEFRRFAKSEVEALIDAWNGCGIGDRATWRKLRDAGYLGPADADQRLLDPLHHGCALRHDVHPPFR